MWDCYFYTIPENRLFTRRAGVDPAKKMTPILSQTLRRLMPVLAFGISCQDKRLVLIIANSKMDANSSHQSALSGDGNLPDKIRDDDLEMLHHFLGTTPIAKRPEGMGHQNTGSTEEKKKTYNIRPQILIPKALIAAAGPEFLKMLPPKKASVPMGTGDKKRGQKNMNKKRGRYICTTCEQPLEGHECTHQKIYVSFLTKLREFLEPKFKKQLDEHIKSEHSKRVPRDPSKAVEYRKAIKAYFDMLIVENQKVG